MLDIERKTCTKCKAEHNREEFHNDKGRKDGKVLWCKKCVKANHDRWRAKNRDHALARQRSYAASRAGTRSPDLPWPTSECSYSAAHQRVRAVRGKPSQYWCVDCGKRATDWSYRKGSPGELTETLNFDKTRTVSDVAYSPDPSHYDPRCRGCHNKLDHWRNRV